MNNGKLIKKSIMIVFAAIFALSLTACGVELSPSEAREKLKADEIAKLIPLSEAFSQEGIWFFSDSYNRNKVITKDDLIQDGILHFDGKGNATYYNFTDAKDKPSFASLKDLSNDEIIDMAMQLSSEAGNTPTTSKFKLSIKTDGTGNNTESEKLIVGEKSFNFTTVLSNQTVFNHTYSGIVTMEKSWFSNCLITRIENEHPGFILDSPDTKGITIE